MIKRAEIFSWFRDEFPGLSMGVYIAIFRRMSDEDLAEAYGLRVLRRGYFVR